jgi:hypothetical protein
MVREIRNGGFMADPFPLDLLEICLIVDCGVWIFLDTEILNINNCSQIQTYHTKPPELNALWWLLCFYYLLSHCQQQPLPPGYIFGLLPILPLDVRIPVAATCKTSDRKANMPYSRTNPKACILKNEMLLSRNKTIRQRMILNALNTAEAETPRHAVVLMSNAPHIEYRAGPYRKRG